MLVCNLLHFQTTQHFFSSQMSITSERFSEMFINEKDREKKFFFKVLGEVVTSLCVYDTLNIWTLRSLVKVVCLNKSISTHVLNL